MAMTGRRNYGAPPDGSDIKGLKLEQIKILAKGQAKLQETFKTVEGTLAIAPTINTGSLVDLLYPLVRGNLQVNNATGNTLFPQYIMIKGAVHATFGGTIPPPEDPQLQNAVRVQVVQCLRDKLPASGAEYWGADTLGTQYAPLGQRACAFDSEFTVVWDSADHGGISIDSALQFSSTLDIFIPAKDLIPITYIPDATNMSGDNASKGALFLVAFSGGNTSATPHVYAGWRVCFLDQ